MANAAPRGKTPVWAVLGLIACLLFAVWWRAHTFAPTIEEVFGIAPWPVVRGEAEPLDCDEAAYAYMARRMVEGDRLYADLSENKPPLGYWIYTGAVAIGGANELAIRVLPIPFVLVTTGLVWWLGLRLGGPGAGVLAAFLAVLLSTDPYVYGNGAQFNQFVNCFSMAGLAAIVAARGSQGRRGIWLAVGGAAIGLATLVKQVSALHLLVFGAAVLMMPRNASEGGADQAGRGRSLGWLVLGFVVILGGAGLVLVAQGVTDEAFDDIVRHGRAMATDLEPEPHAPSPMVRWLTGNADPNGTLPPPFGSTDYLVWWGLGSWPIWLAALPSMGWLTWVRPSFERWLLVGWTISAVLQVIAPGQYWPHYYLLPLPGLALAVALTLGDLARREQSAWWSRLLRVGLIGSVVGVLAIQVKDYLLVPAEQLTIRYKGGRQWVQLRSLGRVISDRTDGWEDPALLVWGWQSPLQIYSGLDSASRHFFTNNLMRDYADRPHPVVSPRIDELMRDLESRRPELVLVAYEPFPRLWEFLKGGYILSSLFPAAPDGRGLWVRRDRWAEFEERPNRTRADSPRR